MNFLIDELLDIIFFSIFILEIFPIKKKKKIGVSDQYLERGWEGMEFVASNFAWWSADDYVSWPPSKLIKFWSQCVDFL